MALLPSQLLHANLAEDETACPICFGTMLQPRALPGCAARRRGMVKVPPWQRPSSAPVPPQGAPVVSGWHALSGRGRPTERPATTSDRCRHVFCAPCIGLWFQLCGSQRTCPIDRRALPADEEPAFDAVADRLLRSRLVRCPNQPLGCTAPPLSLERCQEHLFGACLFRTVQCPHCRKPQSAATLLAHTERCFERCAACGVATG